MLTLLSVEKRNVLVSLAQLVGTMHKICKVRDSNPDHYQKKKVDKRNIKVLCFNKLF